MIVDARHKADGNDQHKLLVRSADSEAVARAVVATESRRAAVGVAECLVRIKEIEHTSRVEERRIVEAGSTDRCRISEEQQSRRFHRMADVAQVAVTEKGRTDRETVALREQTARVAVAAAVRVEEKRLHIDANFIWWKAFLSGIVVTLGISRVRAARTRRLGPVSLILLLGMAAALWRAWRAFSKASSTSKIALDVFLGLARMARSWATAQLQIPALLLPKQEAQTPALKDIDSSDDRASDNASIAVRAPSDSVLSLEEELAAWGLASYAGALVERGHCLDTLAALSAEKFEEVMRLVECKPGHRVKLRKMVEKYRLGELSR